MNSNSPSLCSYIYGWWPKRGGWFHFVPHYSIVCSVDVLRRFEWVSLGSHNCGITFWECALWSRKVTPATLRSMRLFEGKSLKGALIEEKCTWRHILLVAWVRNLIFLLDLRDFLNSSDFVMCLSPINPYAWHLIMSSFLVQLSSDNKCPRCKVILFPKFQVEFFLTFPLYSITLSINFG